MFIELYLRTSDVKSDYFLGKEVSLRGWIHRIRKQKENSFLLLRDDRGGVIQSIFPSSKTNNLTIESSIEIKGIVHKDTRAPEGGYEIKGTTIYVYNLSKPDYPLGEYTSPDLLLEYRHLAIRTRKMIMISKVRSSILRYARDWFFHNDWYEVSAPVLVKGSVEGGSTLFKLKYFDDYAFLSQSAQLYLEAMIFSLGPIWSLTPSFRAERSRTVRHLAEFLHLEAEAPWVTLEDLMKIQEKLVSFIIENTIKARRHEFDFLKRDISSLEKICIPFKKMTYGKAIESLQKKDYHIIDNDVSRMIEFGDDLNIESERILTEDSVTPIFITHYPLKIKPFYVKEDPTTTGVGLAIDLLAPYGFGEISSGGIREDNLEKLIEQIHSEGLDSIDYEWYLDLRRYGSIPHGGFGIGIERLIRWILNVQDIKDTVPFPRTMSRISP